MRGMMWIWLLALTARSAIAQPLIPDTVWTRTIGGPDNDYGFDVKSLPDGSAIVGGSGAMTPPWNEHTAILSKLDRNGNTVWCSEFRATNLREVDAFQITSDGGLFIGGRTTDLDFEVMKMDSSRSVQWESVSPFYADLFLSVCVLECREGGYLAVQSGGSGNFGDVYVLRYGTAGDTLWTRRFGGMGMDRVTSVLQTNDGGHILSGDQDVHYPNGLSADAYIFKLDANGNEEWSHTYGTPDDEWINGLIQTESGYMMVGYVQDVSIVQDYAYVQNVSLTGDSVWARRYSELGQAHVAAACQLRDGNVILCGSRNNTTMLLAVSPDGDILWDHDYAPGSRRYGVSMALSNDNELTLTGWVVTPDSGYQISVMRTESVLAVPWSSTGEIADFNLQQNYPNPFNPATEIAFNLHRTLHVSLKVHDVLGREVSVLMDGMMRAGEHKVSFDGAGLVSGAYFCRLEAGGQTQTKKMVFLK